MQNQVHRLEENKPHPNPFTDLINFIDENERVIVYIDYNNIDTAANKLNCSFDFLKMAEALRLEFNIRDIHLYVALDITKVDSDEFFSFLRKLSFCGILIHTKEPNNLYPRKRTTENFKTSVDVMIATDIVANAKDTDVVMLIAGDSDFAHLARTIRQRLNTKVIVGAIESAHHLSAYLRSQVTTVFPLDSFTRERERRD